MTVSILGCGWFGRSLAKALVEQGIDVKASTTTASKLAQLTTIGAEPFLINIQSSNDSIIDPGFFNCDTLVISNNVKMINREDYLAKVHQILFLIRQYGIRKIIFISSTSVYGDPNRSVSELTLPSPESASAKMLYLAERLFQDEPSFALTILRFAGLVGPGREPARFFAGKTAIPNGLAPVNLVHLDDCIAITQLIITENREVPVLNVVAPDHPEKQQFYRAATEKAGLVIPVFLMDKNNWKIVESVVEKINADYNYKINNWLDWLEGTVGAPQTQ